MEREQTPEKSRQHCEIFWSLPDISEFPSITFSTFATETHKPLDIFPVGLCLI
jgi:hypothetical protein